MHVAQCCFYSKGDNLEQILIEENVAKFLVVARRIQETNSTENKTENEAPHKILTLR